MSNALTAPVARLTEQGLHLLETTPGLGDEAKKCAQVLVANRPQEVADNPEGEAIMVFSGIALGIALQKSQDLVEDAGGFDAVIKSLGLDGQ